jgi:hypothetical protein
LSVATRIIKNADRTVHAALEHQDLSH